MQYKLIIALLFLGSLLFLISCKSTTNSAISDIIQQDTISQSKAGPSVIVYKTTGKYFNKVPVVLSADKTKIVSFPGPKDIYHNGTFSYPTMLENGYLLDNRGIDENSAFLKLTYEEYNKLKKAPSSEELLRDILDNDPFTEMYRCGSRFEYQDLEKELNDIISTGKLNSMKRLK
ncbi:MAG: hypothetical protein R2750_06055 [Bacteroidales bacterium]